MRSPMGLSLRGPGLVAFPAGLPVRSSAVLAAEAGASVAATGCVAIAGQRQPRIYQLADCTTECSGKELTLRDEMERRRNKPTGLLPLTPAPAPPA